MTPRASSRDIYLDHQSTTPIDALVLPDIAVPTGRGVQHRCAHALPRMARSRLGLRGGPVVLRLGAGRFTSTADVERADARVIETVRLLRSADPVMLVAQGARR